MYATLDCMKIDCLEFNNLIGSGTYLQPTYFLRVYVQT